jgi:hypothetical protein
MRAYPDKQRVLQEPSVEVALIAVFLSPQERREIASLYLHQAVTELLFNPNG